MSQHSKITRISRVILPDDVIVEVLSYSPVKSLIRLRCVCKSWNTLISSDPTFVKLHLQRSTRHKHIALTSYYYEGSASSVITFPLNHLLENPSLITVYNNGYKRLELNNYTRIVGSCNGLLCLVGLSNTTEHQNYWFHVWNPATRKISQRLRYFHRPRKPISDRLRFTFGYDNSTDTYKVVAFSSDEVKVCSVRDNVWRNIPGFHDFAHVAVYHGNIFNECVYLSGTVYWLAIQNKLSFSYGKKDFTVEQLIIISLDLSTETYRRLLPPREVDDVPVVQPTLAVLRDRLCFSHMLKITHFAVWQMTEFGVEQSWTQFLKISCQNLQIYHELFPVCLSENGQTLILLGSRGNEVILYNLRENRVEKSSGHTLCHAKDYVESLASIC